VIFILGCFLLADLLQCSIPRRTSLRFQEVTEDIVSDNSIGTSKLKVGAVGNDNIKTKAISADKIDDSSIYQRHFTPNSVTAGAAAIELVHVYFREVDNAAVPNNQGATYNIPDLQESILPYENAPTVNGNINANPTVGENPSRLTAYRVQGKARGPGTILGWYPALNGHLLRYQSSRALRSITCANVELVDLVPELGCGCSFDGDANGDCGCDSYWIGLDSVHWSRDLSCTASCTTPQDICGQYSQVSTPVYSDPQCTNYQYDNDERDKFEPDACFAFTSVEDVNNPQEGTPVYSPSVESISIDNTGVVEIAFFGRGTPAINQPTPDIDIIVVVLLKQLSDPLQFYRTTTVFIQFKGSIIYNLSPLKTGMFVAV